MTIRFPFYYFSRDKYSDIGSKDFASYEVSNGCISVMDNKERLIICRGKNNWEHDIKAVFIL